jgi:hypothetical protein
MSQSESPQEYIIGVEKTTISFTSLSDSDPSPEYHSPEPLQLALVSLRPLFAQIRSTKVPKRTYLLLIRLVAVIPQSSPG